MKGELTSPLHLRITQDIRDRLDIEATRREIGISALVREFIAEGLSRRELDKRVIERIIRELRRD